MKLTSVSNNNLTLLRKLNRKKHRYKERKFFIEGARAVEQVLENGSIDVDALFFDEGQAYWQQQPWEEYLESHNCSLIDEPTFSEISDTDNPQGVLALCRMPDESGAEELANGEGMILAIDAVQDPGNLGTIIRTAAWFGASGLVSGKGTADLFHPKVVRSTAGATGMIPHLNGGLGEILPVFEENGWHVILLDAGTDSAPLQQIDKNEKTVIVVGNEAHGIDSSLVTDSRTKAEIPSPRKSKNVESLNAAIAASIALYALS